ncbi:MAG: cation:proton antiporter [Alphaproteobacteria bacterium]|nr:cation:proton antiporter [Alphaproteobacteria bacterium]
MDSSALLNIFIFLAAACAVVPIAGRFKLGSVLGYLAAGVLIGPFGIGFIHNAQQVMHFAEFGVVMMLFLIGLELEPPMLWKLRKAIIGLGGLQVTLTSAVFTAIGIMLGYSWQISLACGMALSLSSTALVLQMLEEKGLLQTASGESSFAVLLFQDIAVIPILIILPLLVGTSQTPVTQHTMISDFPGWLRTLIIAATIAAIIICGRYLSRHLFYFIAKTNLRELFTATSLALIVGITLLMQLVGVSPALGAFVAGVVLANSEYRHTLEGDIQPFKGLLLGLFFISVGMSIDFALLTAHPVPILGAVVGLMVLKTGLLLGLGTFFGLRDGQHALFAIALSQGGEFAFVLFQYAGGLNILSQEQSAFLTLCVALSMALTPFLMILNDRLVIPQFMSVLPSRQYDTINEKDNPVIIAGFGRFGQIIGRFLNAQGIKTTVLEKDPDQIELLRKFGHRGYFGDATRLDLLINAGAARAKLLVVAVDDADQCLQIVRLAKEQFPNLKIFARARNRRHAYELHKAGVDYFRREIFDSSLTMAQEVMIWLGADAALMRQKAQQFMEHDEKTLYTSFAFIEKEPELISFARQARGELERILHDDTRQDEPLAVPN